MLQVAFLFCLYSRSRWNDVRNIFGYVFDSCENEGKVSGYIEFRTRSHKTARLVVRQGIFMPLIAPIWGVGQTRGPFRFARIAESVSRPLNTIRFEALLPAPRASGELVGEGQRSISSVEASNWLLSLSFRKIGRVAHTTIHTLKATTLSWCGKFGLAEDVRLAVGRHSSGKKSSEIYARDTLSFPLREYDRLMTQVRVVGFRPDFSKALLRTPKTPSSCQNPHRQQLKQAMTQQIRTQPAWFQAHPWMLLPHWTRSPRK